MYNCSSNKNIHKHFQEYEEIAYLQANRMTRIDEEKNIVEIMIRLYCRKKEGNKVLCASCSNLLEYSKNRLEKCRFGNSKPVCRKCSIHCYRKDMQEKIKKVMKFSGPRMILYHPILAIRYLKRKYTKTKGCR